MRFGLRKPLLSIIQAAVTAAYGQLFIQRGGQYINDAIRCILPVESDLNREGEAYYRYLLKAEKANYRCQRVVLATGPWENELLKPLGQTIPLCFERGYHQHFSLNQSLTLQQPCFDVDASYVMTATDLGLRVADLDAPHNPVQLNQVLASVREAIDLGEATTSTTWLGCRPSTPDSLPVIDQVPGYKDLWVAIGHQHIGFSTGPVTGYLLADLISEETPSISADPFQVLAF